MKNQFTMTMALALVVIIIIASVLLLYPKLKDGFSLLPQTPEIERLVRYEKRKDYMALINELYKKRKDTRFSEDVIPWLESRESKGFAPYHYALAMHYNLLGKYKEAMDHYFIAGLIARVDLTRCRDITSERFIMRLESPFLDVVDYLESNPGTRVITGNLALVKEEQVKHRAKPEWLCTQGESKVNPLVAFIEDEDWAFKRAVTREVFEQKISERPGGGGAPIWHKNTFSR